MMRRDKPSKRPRRLEMVVCLAVAAYLAVFLAAGMSDQIALVLKQAKESGQIGQAARHVIIAGSGAMAILGVFMAKMMRKRGSRKRLLLAALASALLSVWQLVHLGGEGVYGAGCAAIAGLAFVIAARDAGGAPGR